MMSVSSGQVDGFVFVEEMDDEHGVPCASGNGAWC